MSYCGLRCSLEGEFIYSKLKWVGRSHLSSMFVRRYRRSHRVSYLSRGVGRRILENDYLFL